MVRIQTDLPYTSVRREDAPNGELPLDDHDADAGASKREAHRAYIVPPRAQASRVRNTSAARAARRQAPLAFRILDPFRALREPNRRRRNEERAADPMSLGLRG